MGCSLCVARTPGGEEMRYPRKAKLKMVRGENSAVYRVMNLRSKDVDKLFTAFYNIDVGEAGGGGKDDALISLTEFLQYYDLERTRVNTRLFGMMDVDGSGEIEFKEFLMTVWEFCTAREGPELMHHSFNLYDENDDGRIDVLTTLKMYAEVYGLSKEKLKQYEFEMYERVEEQHKRFIREKDYPALLRHHPALIYPVLDLQKKMRKYTVGRKFWLNQTKRREKAGIPAGYWARMRAKAREEAFAKRTAAEKAQALIEEAVEAQDAVENEKKEVGSDDEDYDPDAYVAPVKQGPSLAPGEAVKPVGYLVDNAVTRTKARPLATPAALAAAVAAAEAERAAQRAAAKERGRSSRGSDVVSTDERRAIEDALKRRASRHALRADRSKTAGAHHAATGGAFHTSAAVTSSANLSTTRTAGGDRAASKSKHHALSAQQQKLRRKKTAKRLLSSRLRKSKRQVVPDPAPEAPLPSTAHAQKRSGGADAVPPHTSRMAESRDESHAGHTLVPAAAVAVGGGPPLAGIERQLRKEMAAPVKEVDWSDRDPSARTLVRRFHSLRVRHSSRLMTSSASSVRGTEVEDATHRSSHRVVSMDEGQQGSTAREGPSVAEVPFRVPDESGSSSVAGVRHAVAEEVVTPNSSNAMTDKVVEEARLQRPKSASVSRTRTVAGTAATLNTPSGSRLRSRPGSALPRRRKPAAEHAARDDDRRGAGSARDLVDPEESPASGSVPHPRARRRPRPQSAAPRRVRDVDRSSTQLSSRPQSASTRQLRAEGFAKTARPNVRASSLQRSSSAGVAKLSPQRPGSALRRHRPVGPRRAPGAAPALTSGASAAALPTAHIPHGVDVDAALGHTRLHADARVTASDLVEPGGQTGAVASAGWITSYAKHARGGSKSNPVDGDTERSNGRQVDRRLEEYVSGLYGVTARGHMLATTSGRIP